MPKRLCEAERSSFRQGEVLKVRSYSFNGATLALVVILIAGKPFAAQPTSASPAVVADPCQSATVVKQSVAIPYLVGSTASIELIPPSGQGVHICGFLIDGGKFVLFYGGGFNCSWNPIVLFGPTVTTGKNTYSGPGTIFSVPVNNALCLSPPFGAAVSGIITYTQP
jgi:hypothetical protein